MNILAFPEDSKEKCEVLEKWKHFIFSTIYKSLLLTLENDFSGLDKIAAIFIQGNAWPQNL